MNKQPVLTAFIFAFGLLNTLAMAKDILTLKSGRTVEGDVEQELKEFWIFKAPDGIRYRIDPHDIIKRQHVDDRAPQAVNCPETPEPEVKIERPQWKAAFLGGYQLAGSATGNVKDSSGSSVDGFNENSKASFYYGVELHYQPYPLFGVAFSLESYSWNSTISSFGSSNYVGMATPRVTLQKGAFDFWAGLGLGLTLTKIENASMSVNGTAYPASHTNFISIAISPRLGVDYYASDKFFMGLETSYFTTSFGMTGQTTSYTQDYSRRWITLGAKVGFLL